MAGKNRLDFDRLRPNVVHCGEDSLKNDTIGELATQDLRTGPEVVFVVATALKVPARRLVTGSSRGEKAKGGCTVDDEGRIGEARVFAGFAGRLQSCAALNGRNGRRRNA